jgi:serine/threonine-protein phosphatase 2B regulatory subunit
MLSAGVPSLVLSSLLLRCLPVTPSEVDALRELYSKLSNELHQDNIIHKDEFMWALFKANKDNLFAERVFELFDIKQNNVIDFGEFTRSLSVFHPKAPLPEKAKCESRVVHAMCGRGMACSS